LTPVHFYNPFTLSLCGKLPWIQVLQTVGLVQAGLTGVRWMAGLEAIAESASAERDWHLSTERAKGAQCA
jgi:hypothetical protein